MPIYEYECTSCHHQFELIQKFSELPVKQCPQCFQNTATRLVSAPSFQLKGSGWYATDFKDKKKPEVKGKTVADTTNPVAASTDAKPTESKPLVKDDKKND